MLLFQKRETFATALKRAAIDAADLHRWRKEYGGGLKLDQAKRPKELEKENVWLNKLLTTRSWTWRF
jgi:hypothetical protein